MRLSALPPSARLPRLASARKAAIWGETEAANTPQNRCSNARTRATTIGWCSQSAAIEQARKGIERCNERVALTLRKSHAHKQHSSNDNAPQARRAPPRRAKQRTNQSCLHAILLDGVAARVTHRSSSCVVVARGDGVSVGLKCLAWRPSRARDTRVRWHPGGRSPTRTPGAVVAPCCRGQSMASRQSLRNAIDARTA